jgi:hypothetical protein
MNLARKHKELYGNKFTYTLIDERAYNRKLKRNGLIAGVALVIALGYILLKKRNKK